MKFDDVIVSEVTLSTRPVDIMSLPDGQVIKLYGDYRPAEILLVITGDPEKLNSDILSLLNHSGQISVTFSGDGLRVSCEGDTNAT
jgi:hypothetical protein